MNTAIEKRLSELESQTGKPLILRVVLPTGEVINEPVRECIDNGHIEYYTNISDGTNLDDLDMLLKAVNEIAMNDG